MEQDQRPVMETTSPQQRQTISSEVQATLQMLADTDLKLYGEVSSETLDAVQSQGFVPKNGTIQKAESAREEAVRCKQAAGKMKPSVLEQLRKAAKEAVPPPRPEGRPRGRKAR